MAQSALSQQIAELEKQVGAALFERTKRSVSLTPAGAVFLQDAHGILSRYEHALEHVKQVARADLRTLKIGFVGGPFHNILPSLVRRYRAAYPDCEIGMAGVSDRQIAETLAADRIDIAFTVSWAAGLRLIDGTEHLEIGRDWLTVILPEDHRLAGQESIELTELTDERFILLDRAENPQNYDLNIRLCADSGFFPVITCTVKFVQDVAMLVEAGAGIALMPNSLARGFSPNLHSVPVRHPGAVYGTIAVWKSANNNPALCDFVKICRSAVPDNDGG